MKPGWVFLIMAALPPAHAFGDTVYLNNGRSINGIIKQQDDHEVVLEVSGGTVTFKRGEVRSVEGSNDADKQRMREQWQRQQRDSYERSLQEQFKRESSSRQAFELAADTNSILVPVVLNGTLRANLLLDTGASLVTLQSLTAKKLGIDILRDGKEVMVTNADGRQAKAFFVILDRMSAGGMEAVNVEAIILNEEAENEHMSDGLLGMSFLKNFNFKIDYRDKKLILEKL